MAGGGNLLDLVLAMILLKFNPKRKGNKSKNKLVGLHLTKKLLLQQRDHQQNEKAAYFNGRKYLQSYIW